MNSRKTHASFPGAHEAAGLAPASVTFAKNQQQAMLGGFIFLFVANLLAGIMFPIDNMPMLMKWLVNLNPLKFYVEILRGLMLKDASSSFVIQNILALFAIGSGFAYLSYRRMQEYLS